MTNEEPNAVDHTGAPLSEVDNLRSEIKTLEACLRGVQGIVFEDGYEVNVADLKARVTALEGQQRTPGSLESCALCERPSIEWSLCKSEENCPIKAARDGEKG